MAVERRFETGARETASDAPGLVLGEDGVVYKVAPDGTRTAVGSGGSSTVLMASAHITSAELLAGTGKEILPAPGGRLYYVPLQVVYHYRFGTTPYTGDFRPLVGWGIGREELSEGGEFGAYAFNAGDGMNGPVLLQQTEDTYVFVSPNTTYTAWFASQVENKPIGYDPDAIDWPIADGDGSLTVRVIYSLIDGAPPT